MHSTQLPPSPHIASRASSRRYHLLAVALALGLLINPGDAEAKRQKGGQAAAGDTTKKKGVSKVTYQRSASEESPAERDRRLYRECKGMHNAGACLGYTRR